MISGFNSYIIIINIYTRKNNQSFFIIFFIKLMSPEYLHPLNYTPEGRMIATMALLMIGTGFLLMERMNEIEF